MTFRACGPTRRAVCGAPEVQQASDAGLELEREADAIYDEGDANYDGGLNVRFNTLLREAYLGEAGFDLENVFLLRHEDKRVKSGVLPGVEVRTQKS